MVLLSKDYDAPCRHTMNILMTVTYMYPQKLKLNKTNREWKWELGHRNNNPTTQRTKPAKDSILAKTHVLYKRYRNKKMQKIVTEALHVAHNL